MSTLNFEFNPIAGVPQRMDPYKPGASLDYDLDIAIEPRFVTGKEQTTGYSCNNTDCDCHPTQNNCHQTQNSCNQTNCC